MATLWVVEVWTSKVRITGAVSRRCEHLVDLGVLLPVAAFGILFGIPEAERQNTIRFGVRRAIEDVGHARERVRSILNRVQ